PTGGAASAASAACPSSGRSCELPSRHRLPLFEVGGAHDVTVALDVAVLAADDEEHEILVGPVADAPRRRRLDVHEPACLDDVLLALDLERGRAAVDEVELVLRVVVMRGAVVVRREDLQVDAECGHAEGRAELPAA